MKIELIRLTIDNFKGVKHFQIEPKKKSVTIIGKNGTGKTTIADGYYWVFSDADSLGQTRFNVLGLDDDGQTIDDLPAAVEVVIQVDKQKLTLKKVFRQKWVKKKGSINRAFNGNTTEYYFDGAKMNKAKYLQKVAGIIDLENFRTLTDVYFFCAKMKPEDRRAILFEMINPKDGKIDKKYKELYEDMGTLSINEYRDKLRQERKKIEEEINYIPKDIERLNEMSPDLDGKDEVSLRNELKSIQDQLTLKKNEIIAINSGQQTEELKSQLADLKRRRSSIHDERLGPVNAELFYLDREVKEIEAKIVNLAVEIRRKQQKKKAMANDWRSINSSRFKKTDKCFACGQKLPDDQITDQKIKFDAKKKVDLAAIDDRAKVVIEGIKNDEKEVIELKKTHQKNIKVISKNHELITKIETELETKRKSIEADIKQVETKINELVKDKQPEIDAIEYVMGDLENRLAEINSVLLDFVQFEKCKNKIGIRKQNLIDFSSHHESIERKLEMIEQISRDKSVIIEESANKLFSITTWKLFEHHQNGNIKEICEPCRNGVPYSSDLNTGSRINVGLDCIETLSKHFNIYFPVIVDNAESVTEWRDNGRQIIKLMAQANVNELEVIK